MFNPIPLRTLTKRIGMSPMESVRLSNANVKNIVSLRDLVLITSVQPMRRDYLQELIRNIPIAGDREVLVYKNCTVRTERIDPHSVYVGQTFVERAKYQKFLENFDSLFGSFCVSRGMAKLCACVVVGKIASGEYAVAHYIPPMIEENVFRAGSALLDGMHRMFLTKQVGTTIETIVVSGVEVPFPADLHGWDKVNVVGQKPPPEERFNNLRPNLFRDLKYVGVDG